MSHDGFGPTDHPPWTGSTAEGAVDHESTLPQNGDDGPRTARGGGPDPSTQPGATDHEGDAGTIDGQSTAADFALGGPGAGDGVATTVDFGPSPTVTAGGAATIGYAVGPGP